MTTHGFVGDLLIRTGVVDAAGLARAADAPTTSGTTIGRKLSVLGLADESVVARTIATAARLDYLDGTMTPAQEIVALLPEDFCRKRGVLPLALDGRHLRVAVTDPMDYSVLQDVEFRTGKKTVAVVVTQTWLEQRCARVYPEPDRPLDLRHARGREPGRRGRGGDRGRVRAGRSRHARQGRRSCRRSSSSST